MEKRAPEPLPVDGRKPKPHVHKNRVAIPHASNGLHAKPFLECVTCFTTQDIKD